MYDSVIAAAKPRFRIAWEAVGFESGFGPEGLGNLAQALAWVVFVFSRESPVGAPGEYPIELKNQARRNADDGVLRPDKAKHVYSPFVRFLGEASLNDGEVIIETRRSAHVSNMI